MTEMVLKLQFVRAEYLVWLLERIPSGIEAQRGSDLSSLMTIRRLPLSKSIDLSNEECYTFFSKEYNLLTRQNRMGLSNLMKAKVSLKGWVVIPAALRRRYRLKPGTVVEFREEGEKLYIVPCKQDPVEELFGKLAGPVSLSAALLEDRAAELKREEASLRL